MKEIKSIIQYLDSEKVELIQTSKKIFNNPELGMNEVFASKLLSEYLSKEGFDVRLGIGYLETAFVASYEKGRGGLHIALCAEYDALPDIGHACGHNLIGVASVAAGLAIANSDLDIPFKVSVIGTPDEEGSGGKIDLINMGIFKDVDIAMMFHPGYSMIINTESLALQNYSFIFHGKSAHAASEPWEGINALDAVIQTFNNVSFLRQHLKDDVRIHGIIKEGGKATNIIPDKCLAEFCIRSKDNEYLKAVVEKVFDCARAAATATGAQLEIEQEGHFYDAMISNSKLSKAFEDSLKEIDYINIGKFEEGLGSIDMGNVSKVVPSIHPVLPITNKAILGHTREFAELSNSDQAYETMLDASKALAITAIKVIKDKSLQEEIIEEFKANTME